MRLRRVDIFSRVSRSPGVAPFPRVGAIGGADGRGAVVARSAPADAPITSGLETAPPRPLPETAAMSTPRSSATRRAPGDDLVPAFCVVAEDGAGPSLRAA